jgi:large subunit ribosomal protein L25
METIDLNVEPRGQTGKGAARGMRRDGRVPAVLYGAKRTTIAAAVDGKEFETKVAAIEGTHLIRLNCSDAELGGRLVLVKEIQRHPVTHRLLHADLYEVDVTAKLKLRVPLHFVGRAQGVEMGGILQPIRREIEVLCLPTEIPDYLEIDVTPLGIHEAVHMSDIAAPTGVEIVFETDEAVVTVLPPVVEEAKVAPEGEAAEGAPAATAAEGAAKPEAAKSAS